MTLQGVFLGVLKPKSICCSTDELAVTFHSLPANSAALESLSETISVVRMIYSRGVDCRLHLCRVKRGREGIEPYRVSFFLPSSSYMEAAPSWTAVTQPWHTPNTECFIHSTDGESHTEKRKDDWERNEKSRATFKLSFQQGLQINQQIKPSWTKLERVFLFSCSSERYNC